MAKERRSTTGVENDDVHPGGYSSEQIAARAYELYLARGAADGQDFDDWIAAERELATGPSQGDRSTEPTRSRRPE